MKQIIIIVVFIIFLLFVWYYSVNKEIIQKETLKNGLYVLALRGKDLKRIDKDNKYGHLLYELLITDSIECKNELMKAKDIKNDILFNSIIEQCDKDGRIQGLGITYDKKFKKDKLIVNNKNVDFNEIKKLFL
jgi:hypothetical protein